MRRFLRLLTLWLFALALPVQGAATATGMAAHAGAPSHTTMTMPDGTTIDAAAMPCHAGHAIDKAGCGACCGPVAAQPGTLAVAPVAMRSARAAPACAAQPVPQFLTGGPDRPPRDLRA